jgi:hypothetical protein
LGEHSWTFDASSKEFVTFCPGSQTRRDPVGPFVVEEQVSTALGTVVMQVIFELDTMCCAVFCVVPGVVRPRAFEFYSVLMSTQERVGGQVAVDISSVPRWLTTGAYALASFGLPTSWLRSVAPWLAPKTEMQDFVKLRDHILVGSLYCKVSALRTLLAAASQRKLTNSTFASLRRRAETLGGEFSLRPGEVVLFVVSVEAARQVRQQADFMPTLLDCAAAREGYGIELEEPPIPVLPQTLRLTSLFVGSAALGLLVFMKIRARTSTGSALSPILSGFVPLVLRASFDSLLSLAAPLVLLSLDVAEGVSTLLWRGLRAAACVVDSHFDAVVADPILEELCKRIPYGVGRAVAWALGIYEGAALLGAAVEHRSPSMAVLAALRVPQHLIVGRLPLRWGIALHVAWNYLSVSFIDPVLFPSFVSETGMKSGWVAAVAALIGFAAVAASCWCRPRRPASDLWFDAVDASPFETVAFDGPVTGRWRLREVEPDVAYPPLDETAKIKVVGLSDPPNQVPKGGALVGIGYSRWPAHVAASTQYNLETALRVRFLADTPKPKKGFVRQHWQILLTNLLPWSHDVDPVPFEEWISRFPPSKRREFLRLVHSDYDEFEQYVYSVFTKREKIFKREDYAPRLICGVDNRVKVNCGPWQQGLSSALKTILWVFPIQGFVTITYGAGLLQARLTEWLHEVLSIRGTHIIAAGDDVFIACNHDTVSYWTVDGSKHDLRMQVEDLRNELRVGLLFGAPLSWIQWKESEIAGRHLTSRKGIKARVEGRRATGGIDTTPANTLAALVRAFSACGSGQCPPQDLSEFLAEEWGYKNSAKTSPDLSKVDFLSGTWYPVLIKGEATSVWGPLVGRALVRLGWTASRHPSRAQLRGVMIGYSEFSWLPVLGAFLSKTLDLLGDGGVALDESRRWEHSVLPNVAGVEATPETWAFVAARYDMGVEDLQAAVSEIAAVTSLPWLLDSAAVERMAVVDLE